MPICWVEKSDLPKCFSRKPPTLSDPSPVTWGFQTNTILPMFLRAKPATPPANTANPAVILYKANTPDRQGCCYCIKQPPTGWSAAVFICSTNGNLSCGCTKCKMPNAKCKMEVFASQMILIRRLWRHIHFTFSILNFAFLSFQRNDK